MIGGWTLAGAKSLTFTNTRDPKGLLDLWDLFSREISAMKLQYCLN